MKDWHILVFICIAGLLAGCRKDRMRFSPTADEPGTQARFTQAGDHLYLVNGRQLDVYMVAASGRTELQTVLPIDFVGRADAIYARDNHIFISNRSKTFMFDISSPVTPQYKGEADFLSDCMQMEVIHNAAYVFRRSVNRCGSSSGLWVYDLTNGFVSFPPQAFDTLMPAVNSIAPFNDHAYVAARSNGIHIFDVSAPLEPELKNILQSNDFTDCFIYNDLLFCVLGFNALAAYSLQDPVNPELVSILPD